MVSGSRRILSEIFKLRKTRRNISNTGDGTGTGTGSAPKAGNKILLGKGRSSRKS